MKEQKLYDIADLMVDAIYEEVGKNQIGYRKYPNKVEIMIKNLREIITIIIENKL